jgi:hypothetical protein
MIKNKLIYDRIINYNNNLKISVSDRCTLYIISALDTLQNTDDRCDFKFDIDKIKDRLKKKPKEMEEIQLRAKWRELELMRKYLEHGLIRKNL